MKLKILTFIFFILLISCKAQTNDKDIINILKKTVESSQFQNYLYPEIENRNILFLVKNEYMNSDIKMDINNIDKFIVTEKEKIKGDNYMLLKHFYITEKNKAIIVLYYKIENIEVKSNLIKKYDEWVIENIDIIEF
ncbi:MAG: hypothetical protein IIC67_00325 [Thaumarchaeota archaeon]|nr:hypothetical protein [Nitrososphaerota archaeon]